MALTHPHGPPPARPSRLQLDRYATGELDADARAQIEAQLDDRARAHLAAVEAARATAPRPDWDTIRRRAAALDSAARPAEPAPAPANDVRAFRWGPLLAIAAAALVLLLVAPRLLAPGVDPDYVGVRSGEQLALYQLTGDVLVPWAEGTALGEADVIGFQVAGPAHRAVVLLSVDGTGTVSVFHPASGDAPLPLGTPDEDGRVPLPGTVILDGAPGPEVFVAVFDERVSAARGELQRRFQSGGHAAVLEWAEQAEGVVAVEVPRR